MKIHIIKLYDTKSTKLNCRIKLQCCSLRNIIRHNVHQEKKITAHACYTGAYKCSNNLTIPVYHNKCDIANQC